MRVLARVGGGGGRRVVVFTFSRTKKLDAEASEDCTV